MAQGNFTKRTLKPPEGLGARTPQNKEGGREHIEARPIIQEMRESYLDYAMSVIVSRALPDVRDGLKPVHRRILFVAHELGLSHAAKFRKSAAVIGDTLARYHPHGDMAVYDAMAHLAQDFAMRYPLIDGQGNWGSIDGDPPAAHRYTEARMSALAEELLKDKENLKVIEHKFRTKISLIPNPAMHIEEIKIS